MAVSERLLAEVGEVLRWGKLERYLPEEVVPVYLEPLRSVSLLVDEVEDGTRYTEDPDDDYLVSLSLSSGAERLVSGDRHLLGLEGGGLPVVVSPAEFLKSLGVR